MQDIELAEVSQGVLEQLLAVLARTSDVRVGLSRVKIVAIRRPVSGVPKADANSSLVPVAKCQMPSSPLHETWVAGQVSTPMSKITRRHE
jgi:hypothetical protein